MVNLKHKTLQKEAEKKDIPRIRGPHLKVRALWDLSFTGALELADRENFVIPSNRRITRAYLDNDRTMRESGGCWTGTMTAYAKPGERLGRFIVATEGSQRYIFPVPEQYRNERDAILVVEHPNFRLVRDGDDSMVVVADSSKVECITNFPRENGRYLGDEKHDISSGEEVSRGTENARYLWRSNDARVVPVLRPREQCIRDSSRGLIWGGAGYVPLWCDIALQNPLYFKTGLLLETPERQTTIREIDCTIEEMDALLKRVSRDIGIIRNVAGLESIYEMEKLVRLTGRAKVMEGSIIDIDCKVETMDALLKKISEELDAFEQVVKAELIANIKELERLIRGAKGEDV